MEIKQSQRGLQMRAALALAAAALAAGPALAAEPAWPSAPYDYIVVDQDLRTVLLQFGANIGVRVALSDGVQGRVHGRLPTLPPRDFLSHVAQAYGLDWFFDGVTLSISAANEAETRFVPLAGTSVPALEAALRTTGLYDPRFGLREGPAGKTALVAGPPRYLKAVEQTAAALAVPEASPSALPGAVVTLTVFRGGAASKVQFP